MKHSFYATYCGPVLGGLLLGWAATAYAGHVAGPQYAVAPLANDEAMQHTRRMAQELALTEQQFIRLLPLNRLYLAQRALIGQQSAGNLGTRTARLTQLEADYEQAYRYLLTPQQLRRLPACPAGPLRFDLGMSVVTRP